MSEQDKSLLDEQAELVRAVYRALPDEEIPTEIERRILENAASAIKPRSGRRWLQWSAPLASAAVVLLVVGVVMQPQSQREMVPESAVMVDLQMREAQQVTVPAPQIEAPTPRMAAKKPNLSAIPPSIPKPIEDARVPPGAPPPNADAAVAKSQASPEMAQREPSVSSAFELSSILAEERKEREADFPPTRAPDSEAASAAGAADPSAAARKRTFADESRRSALMRAAPTAAASVVDPALNISPALRAELEKFLSVRMQANASAADSMLAPSLDQLRHDYPGVDIDAALRALERMQLERVK